MHLSLRLRTAVTIQDGQSSFPGYECSGLVACRLAQRSEQRSLACFGHLLATRPEDIWSGDKWPIFARQVEYIAKATDGVP